MKKKSFPLSYFVYAALFLAAALVFVQLFLYLSYYDFEKTLWKLDTPSLVKALPYILVGISTLFAVAFAFSAKQSEEKDSPFISHPDTLATRIGALIIVFSLVGTLLAQIVSIGSYDHLSLLLDSDSASYAALPATFHILTLLLALPCAYFFLTLIRGKKASLVMGFPVVFYLLFLTLRTYFDMSQLLNDPRWSFRTLTLILTLTFMLFDLHLMFAKKMLTAFRAVAVVALVTASASGIAGTVFGITNRIPFGIETFYHILEIGFAVYIGARLIALSQEKPLENTSEELLVERSEAPDEVPCEETATTPEADVPTEEASEELAEDTVATPEASAEESEAPSEEEQPEDAATAPEGQAPVEKAEESPTEDLPDLTEGEVKRFYKAILLSITKRRGVQDPSPEEKAAIKEEANALVAGVLQTEDRNERIAVVRCFLEKSGI